MKLSDIPWRRGIVVFQHLQQIPRIHFHPETCLLIDFVTQQRFVHALKPPVCQHHTAAHCSIVGKSTNLRDFVIGNMRPFSLHVIRAFIISRSGGSKHGVIEELSLYYNVE